MQSTSQVSSPLLAIPGVLASIFSLAIGLVALLTSLASFGRQAEYGYLISPGAGGILFIHLAIAGMVGMAIYLDQVKQDDLNNLTFIGDITGHLISQHRDEKDWFPYTLTFRRVLAYFSCELDTYKNMAGTEYIAGSSFDLIEDSTWLMSLPVREDFDKGIYRHYRLFTYDDVYNIIAVSYEFAAEL